MRRSVARRTAARRCPLTRGLMSIVVIDSALLVARPQLQEAVGEREGLQALRGVEVEALLLVDEVEPGPDDGDAVDGAGGQHATVAERADAAIDGELREHG